MTTKFDNSSLKYLTKRGGWILQARFNFIVDFVFIQISFAIAKLSLLSDFEKSYDWKINIQNVKMLQLKIKLMEQDSYLQSLLFVLNCAFVYNPNSSFRFWFGY